MCAAQSTLIKLLTGELEPEVMTNSCLFALRAACARASQCCWQHAASRSCWAFTIKQKCCDARFISHGVHFILRCFTCLSSISRDHAAHALPRDAFDNAGQGSAAHAWRPEESACMSALPGTRSDQRMD